MKFIRHLMVSIVIVGALIGLLYGFKGVTGNAVFGNGSDRGGPPNGQKFVFPPNFQPKNFGGRDGGGGRNTFNFSNWPNYAKPIGPEVIIVAGVIFYDKRFRKKRKILTT